MNNIIDSIQISGVTYTIQGSGGTVSSAITSGDTNAVAGGAVYEKFDEVEQVTARALNDLHDSISGKADSSDVYTKSEVDDAISAATSGLATPYSAGTNIDITNNVISVTGISIETSSAITSGDTNPVQGGALWDELRLTVGGESGLTLEWELYDGGGTTNYPSGQCSKIIFENISTTEAGAGYEPINYFSFDNSEGYNIGHIEISINDGVVTVDSAQNVTYSISGNNVTVEYPSIAANVDHIYASYDNYWTTIAYINSTVYTPLIDQVSANTATLASLEENVNENEEVTARALVGLSEADEVAARALVDLNDRFGGLKLVKLTQQEYDNLQNKDNNTLYVIA